MTEPTATPPANPRRSLWRRITSAQESGLILVILALMGALTLLGGSKNKPVRIDLPPDAVVVERDNGDIVVTRTGQTTEYAAGAGWHLRDAPDGARCLFGSQRVNRFFESGNLVLLTTDASYIAIMAVGMTAIIILSGIDLSIGSIYAFAAMVGAAALAALPGAAGAWLTVPVGLFVCSAAGALGGLLNGAMIVGLRVHPFIITLGTMAVYRGIVLLFTAGLTISGMPDSFQRGFFKAEVWGVYPVPTAIMVVVALAGMFVLRWTVLGRRVYAIGGNEVAARYAGIPVGLVKIVVYTLGGVLAGLSACMYIGYLGAAASGAGQGYELSVIAAAVIGGASLSGGRGSAIGAVLGAILVELINNAMVILEINQSYNQVVMGTAIIVAVVVDQAKRRLAKG